MKDKRFAGVLPILHTPFTPDGAIDEASLRRQVAFCLRARVHGVVIPAGTSEFFALSDAERTKLIALTLDEVDGRVPVIACASAGAKETVLEHCRSADAQGAAGLLIMPPYIRKPDSTGIFAFFQALAETVSVSIVIQDAPGPMGVPMSSELIGRIVRDVPGTWYVKEEVPPSGERISVLLKHHGDHLTGVFGAGSGSRLLDELGRGSCGAMPSAAFATVNVRIYEAFCRSDMAAARDLYCRALPLMVLRDQYMQAMGKLILQRMGVIAHTTVRDPATVFPDEVAVGEMDRLLAELRPLMSPD